MENKHHSFNCNKLKHVNGPATIVSSQKSKIHSKNGQNDKRWILRTTDQIYDFRKPRLKLKRSNLRNPADFLSSKNSVLKFHGTYPLQHSFFNCATSLFCTDNYFNDKKIFERNITKIGDKNLWIPNEALDSDCSNCKYETDIAMEDNSPVTVNDNTETGKQKLCSGQIDNREIEKSAKIKVDGKKENDAHVFSNKRNNVLQVFCVNGREPDFPTPMNQPSISEEYVSATEPAISSTSECIRTCFRSEVENMFSQPITNGMGTMRMTTQNERICQSKKTAYETKSPELKNACLGQYLSSSLTNITEKCRNMKECSIHENDSASLSALSLFFIMKDLNINNCSCIQNEGYGLLSTAMICLRMNTNSEETPPLLRIEKNKRERSNSCSDISKHNNDFTKNTARTKTPVNSRHTVCSCLSNRADSNETGIPTYSEKPGTNNFKVLEIQAPEHNENRRHRELNLLLSFHPDKRNNLHVKDHPHEASRSVHLRSYSRRENCRTDKGAQASVLQKCACIQPSLTKAPNMHQKCNQICPSRKSTSIQPSSTIFLRESKPTTFSCLTNDRRFRVDNSTETPSNIYHSPPPYPLFLSGFKETSRKMNKAKPQKHFTTPISMDLHEDKDDCSLACIEVKKNLCSSLKQKKNTNLNTQPSFVLPCDERISGDFSEIKISNPSKNNFLRLSSTNVIGHPEVTSNTCDDLKAFMECNSTRDSEEGLNILNLKQRPQYSKLLKKRELLSSYEFRSANDFVHAKENMEDLKLITEDFQSLKKAIEEFMTIT